MRFHALLAIGPAFSAGPAAAGVIYTSLDDFESVAGKPTSWVDLEAGDFPRCADVDHFAATGTLTGKGGAACVASYTFSAPGRRTYTMRGEAWHTQLAIRSGNVAGTTSLGGGYEAQLWDGPATNIRPDPLGGEHLAVEFRRPFIGSLGVHTTAGFFGWLETGPEAALLVLPRLAEITRLDFDHAPTAVSAPGSFMLALSALAMILLPRRARALRS